MPTIPDRFVTLAQTWYDGSGSMLYAISSTGNLTFGSIRPNGADGPMSDSEWGRYLYWKLSRELGYILDSKPGRYHQTDLRLFKEWVDSERDKMD